MRTTFLLLYTVLIATLAFAQSIRVVKTNGEIGEFNLADIENFTFSLEGSGVANYNLTDKIDAARKTRLHRDAFAGTILEEGTRDKLRIHTASAAFQLLVSQIENFYIDADVTHAVFQTSTGTNPFTLADIDSITFTSELDSSVQITFNGTEVSVSNPLELLGVSIKVSGADVVVNSTAEISHIHYVLSGTTSNGMFKIYSDKKLDLHFNQIEITNPDGPAINIQSDKEITVHLEDGTTNILTDGKTYSSPINNEEQDGAFFSEGQLIFTGTGNLTINGFGADQHGLRSDDYIEINQGNITINRAEKDGIHANDGFFMNGGTVEVTADGDGIDGSEGAIEITDGNIIIHSTNDDKDAIKCDSTLQISGGAINITVAGKQSKGLNSSQDILISGGNVNITTSGGVVLEASGSGYDPSYCTAINADANVYIGPGTVTITTSGIAGRGISCDGDFTMNSGTLQITSSGGGSKYTNESGAADAYHGPCIKADGIMNLSGGNIILRHSGSGGKGLSCDTDIIIGSSATVPTIEITTTGQAITIVSGGTRPGTEGEYAEAKAISADGAVTIGQGNLTISSADDGIKSKKSITINDGILEITKSVEGLEGPLITFNGGKVSVTASDDALNATYGNGGEANDGSRLTFNGGYVVVNATNGDALDSNGDIFINGGTIIAHGPQSDPEVGMDVNGVCKITGGFLVLSGLNSNMTEGPGTSSTQYSVLLRTNQALSAGTLFHIEDSQGNNLVTFAPNRRYYSIIFSAPALAAGTTYKVYTGGSSTGTFADGLYSNGAYSGGTLRTSFSLTSKANTVWF